jgi:pimeloyl-ACP methyl ester carboxylesterase
MNKLAFLFSLFFGVQAATGQNIPYGNNPVAGKYVDVGDAKLYYEVYGTGKPLLLLHGDTFGYITEFDQYLPLLSKHFKVIAPGMRGHGKSELGTKKYSYKLFAEDALAVLGQEKIDSVVVVGFSAGAITAYYLAAYHPEKVTKVVAMAGALDSSAYRQESWNEFKTRYTGDDFEKMLPDVVKERKALMPKPNSYNELIEKLRDSWRQTVYVERQKAAAIRCPVLTVAGDRDEYFKTESFVAIQRLIPGSQLGIIPGCNHVCLILYPEMFTVLIMPFLLRN